MSVEQLDFKELRESVERGLGSDLEIQILTLFESAITDPAIDDKIETLYNRSSCIRFRILYRSRVFYYEHIASPGANRESHSLSILRGQDILAKIVGDLNNAGEPWKGIPGFWICIRDFWNHSPTFELDAEDDRPFTLSEWLNLNSFVARIFSTTFQDLCNFAIWELRNGLEEDLNDTNKDVSNTLILVACEWILQSGRRLMQESLRNSSSTEPEDGNDGTPYRGGPLHAGVKGFGLERWGFWKRTLVELCEVVPVGETANRSSSEAVEMMARVEREIANTFQ